MITVKPSGKSECVYSEMHCHQIDGQGCYSLVLGLGVSLGQGCPWVRGVLGVGASPWVRGVGSPSLLQGGSDPTQVQHLDEIRLPGLQ